MTIPVPGQLSQAQLKNVFLLELHLDAGVQRFNSSDRKIVWGGYDWVSFPFAVEEVKRSNTGILDAIRIGTTNVSREISQLLLLERFRGKTLILYVAAFATQYTLASPVVELFNGLMDDVNVEEGKESASVVIGAALDLAFWQRPIPGRIYQATCGWVTEPSPSGFKGTECKYAGAEGACNGTWDRCKELLNSDNFGGFRHLPQIETMELWWGRAGVFKV